MSRIFVNSIKSKSMHPIHMKCAKWIIWPVYTYVTAFFTILVQWRNLFVLGIMLKKRLAVILKIPRILLQWERNKNQLYPIAIRSSHESIIIIIWITISFQAIDDCFIFYYFNSKTSNNDYYYYHYFCHVPLINNKNNLCSVHWFTFIELECYQCQSNVAIFHSAFRLHRSSKSLARKESQKRNNSRTTNIHYALYHFTMMRI